MGFNLRVEESCFSPCEVGLLPAPAGAAARKQTRDNAKEMLSAQRARRGYGWPGPQWEAEAEGRIHHFLYIVGAHEETPKAQATNTARRLPQRRLRWPGRHQASSRERGRGSWHLGWPGPEHRQNSPGLCGCNLPLRPSEAGSVCPAHVPGGRSAARCRREERTADYRADPEPAEGRLA